MSASAYSTTLTASPLLCTGRLLDTIPKAGSPIALAYSVRKVSTAYKGACMRVRRSSDNREIDIGFVQTYLDIASLKKFVGGFDGYVTIWYDQSGRGRDASQSDPTLQPLVVRKGSVIFDTKSNNVTIEFNGTHLVTDWEPSPADATNGMGILAVSAVGLLTPGSELGGVSPQPGIVTSRPQTDLAVTTDYPSPLLPIGYDTHLFEGLNVIGSTGPEVLYMENSRIYHVSVDPITNTFTKTDSQVMYPSGPALLTVDTITDGVPSTGRTEQWHKGIQLSNGKIYAIPYRASTILEINPLTRVITNIPLPVENGGVDYTGDTSGKWWTAVASEDKTKAFCIPSSAEKVLLISINATTQAAEVSYIGDKFASGGEKWRDAVLVPSSSGGNGRIYAMPFKYTGVLEIDPTTNSTRILGSNAYGEGTLGLSSAGTLLGYYNYATVVGSKAYGIPWAAATLLVIDTSTTPLTMRLVGTTGMTPFFGIQTREGDFAPAVQYGGRGYVADPLPTLVVSPPDYAGGASMALTATVQITSHVSGITKMTAEGDGYTGSPNAFPQPGPYTNTNPAFAKPTPFGANPTMVAVVPTEPNTTGKQIHYKITGVQITHGGDGISPNNGKAQIWFSGGKGSNASAQAIIDKSTGKVILATIVNGGQGYTSNPTVVFKGGGGRGAQALVTWDDDIEKSNRTPLVYSNTGGLLTSTGGELKGTLTITNPGSGYRSAPSISFVGGRGDTDATAYVNPSDIIYVEDGKITKINITNGGTGYTVNSEIAVTLTPPWMTTPPGNLGGETATAEIYSVDEGTRAITAIRLKNCGSGYVVEPTVTIDVPPGGGTQATATAVFKLDGRINSLTCSVQGTCYTREPAVTFGDGSDGRKIDEGLGAGTIASTPGSGATISVWLEGVSGSVDPSPYRHPNYNNSIPLASRMPRGSEKFSAPFVSGTNIYCLPHWTHRILQINTTNESLDDVTVSPRIGQVLSVTDFGVARAQYVAGVSVPRGGSASPVFYGIPFTGREQIVKITDGVVQFVAGPTNQDLLFRGGWNAGVLAFNGCIYCAPRTPNALLVIDTKTESKSEAVSFSNIRSKKTNKWYDIVAAGSTAADGLLYGIPADIDVVLELNPGAALRRKSLPAAGCVLQNGKKKVVFAAANGVTLYDAETKQAVLYDIIPTTPQVTYVEGVQIADGNVIFVPCYNQTDTFPYSGNVGVFNPATNTFSMSTKVELELAPPFPSRSAVAFGASVNEGKRVAWVPRGTTNAVVTYNHQDTSKLVEPRGVRQETSVTYASAQRVGTDDATASTMVATIPTTTEVKWPDTYPVVAFDNNDFKFSGAVLVSKLNDQNVRVFGVVLLPSEYQTAFRLFYPNDRTAAANIQVATPTDKVTLIDPPVAMATAFQDTESIRGSMKFQGGVLGADDKVYCVPHNYNGGVVVVDPVDYSVTEIGRNLNPGVTNAMYWGGVLAGNNKIYFCPYRATSVMVIDPSIDNPVNRISYIQLPEVWSTSTTAKWRGCCLSPTGKIVCAPYNATAVLIIDPATDTASLAYEDATWITETPSERFSGCVTAIDGNVFMVPYNAASIVTLDTTDLTLPAKIITPTRVIADEKWSGGVVSTNGKLYLIPALYPNPLEYNPVDDTVTLLPALNVSTRGAQFGDGVLLQDGTILAFPSGVVNNVLEISVDGQYIGIYDHTSALWKKCGRVANEYRLRPFTLSDKTSVFFHSGNGQYAVFDSENATVDTVPVYGPSISDGVAVHYPDDSSDTIRSFRDDIITEISPNAGGMVGVKSYTGYADVSMTIDNADFNVRVGNGAVGVETVFENLYGGGALGVFSSYFDAPKGTLDMYLRDTLLGGKNGVVWNGETGNTFSVGRVVGTEQMEFNAPAYVSGFTGTISELAVFSSNQQSRAATLADNSTFFFDSQMP